MQTILFIDGRNFIGKIESILEIDNKKDVNLSVYNFVGLFDKVLSGIEINKKVSNFIITE